MQGRRCIRNQQVNGYIMNTKKEQPTNEKNLRIAALMDLLGIGRSTVYDLIKKGQLPEPIKIGRSSVWLKSEIDAVIEERKSAREAA